MQQQRSRWPDGARFAGVLPAVGSLKLLLKRTEFILPFSLPPLLCEMSFLRGIRVAESPLFFYTFNLNQESNSPDQLLRQIFIKDNHME